MKAVTIDNLPIDTHQKYAESQKMSAARTQETLSAFPEILGTSTIFASKLEELLETPAGSTPWATFCPPPGYTEQAKRFLESFALFLKEIRDNTEEGASENPELRKFVETVNEKIETALANEKDKGTLLNMVDCLGRINEWVWFVKTHNIRQQRG